MDPKWRDLDSGSAGKYNDSLSDSRSEIYHTRLENWFAID